MGLVAGPWPGRPGAEFIGGWGCFQFAGRTMWACHQAASLPFQSSCPWSEGSFVFCNLLPGSQNFHKGTFVCGCQPNHCLCREMQTGDFLFHYLARVTPCLSFPRIDQTCQLCYSRLSNFICLTSYCVEISYYYDAFVNFYDYINFYYILKLY